MNRILPLSTLLTLVIACGGSTTDPPSPVDGGNDATPTDAATDAPKADGAPIDAAPTDGGVSPFCAQRAAWETSCAKNPSTTCAASEAQLRCMIDAPVVDKLAACLWTRPCNTSDDTCFDSTEATISTTWRTACLQKQASCANTADAFKDDLCFGSELLKSPFKTGIQACLSKATCAEIKSCFGAEATKIDTACP